MAADSDDRLLQQLQLDQRRVRSRAQQLVDDYRSYFDGRPNERLTEEAQIDG